MGTYLHARPVLPDQGKLALDYAPGTEFSFEGPVGKRLQANMEQWQLVAPYANPGMLAMMRLRDRLPEPELVWWAGEFVGKFLLSCIENWQLTREPRLRGLIVTLVDRLEALQAEDGYLGPFPKDRRLLGAWDLWGHYHIMMGLLTWFDLVGDERCLAISRRIADLVCATYLEQEKSLLEAGFPEMNLAIIHSLGWLYRLTGEDRYLWQLKAIERDFEKAGDYVLAGAAGVPFYMTPSPRWESLHDMMGLLELWRISGDETYSRALSNHWQSIWATDVHNTGAFTTHEQAIGNPFSPGAIETCCVIAWCNYTLEQLRLTGDCLAADAFELAFWNSLLGAQHPSGRWWTYDTPMDGKKLASAHSIVFQSRAGTPELNCCSVNSSRGLGMLAKWAVMTDEEGLVLNYWGPVTISTLLPTGERISLTQVTEYPVGEVVRLTVTPDEPLHFRLKLRIPGWSKGTSVRVNGERVAHVAPGEYLSIARVWQPGDLIEVDFDFSPRLLVGDGECRGKVSVYRGPLLLAYDQLLNTCDPQELPAIDASKPVVLDRVRAGDEWFPPLVAFKIETSDPDKSLVLCDFASAGALGCEYRSWLPAIKTAPPEFDLVSPKAEARLGPGRTAFRWAFNPQQKRSNLTYRLIISTSPDLGLPALEATELRRSYAQADLAELPAGRAYYWGVVAENDFGKRAQQGAPRRFFLDAAAEVSPLAPEPDAEGILVADALAGQPEPTRGVLLEAVGIQSAGGAVSFSGSGLVRYAVPWFPLEYTLSLWFRADELAKPGLQQLFSAWRAGGDDPLRLTLEGGKLRASLQHFMGIPTPPAFEPEAGRWYHAAVTFGPESSAPVDPAFARQAVSPFGSGAVSEADAQARTRIMKFYVEGKLLGSALHPVGLATEASDFALGANPHMAGEEFVGALAGFTFYEGALDETAVGQLAARQLDLT